jgi:hypothetical protein
VSTKELLAETDPRPVLQLSTGAAEVLKVMASIVSVPGVRELVDDMIEDFDRHIRQRRSHVDESRTPKVFRLMDQLVSQQNSSCNGAVWGGRVVVEVRAREDTKRLRKGSRARDGARGVWDEVRAVNHDVEVADSRHQSKRRSFGANKTDVE